MDENMDRNGRSSSERTSEIDGDVGWENDLQTMVGLGLEATGDHVWLSSRK